MKTKKDGHRTIRFAALILLPCVCMLAIQLVLTTCSYADGASGKSNGPVGQTNEGEFIMKGFVKTIEDIAVKLDGLLGDILTLG